MKIFALTIIWAICSNCHNKNTDVQPGKKAIPGHETLDSLLKPIKLFEDAFFQDSYLGYNGDTLIFIKGHLIDHTAPYMKNIFYYNSGKKEFYYTNSTHSKTPPDSFKILQKNNYLPQALFVNKKERAGYYKEINKSFAKPLSILRKDLRMRLFNNKYYAVDGEYPDFIYVIDPLNRSVDSLNIAGAAFDAINILVEDFDKDGSPEMIIFHKDMMPRNEMIAYNVYSIRQDSIPAFIGPQNILPGN